jgi:NADH-quinone oxidoreductase subunit L
VQQKDWVNKLYEYLLIRPFNWITHANRKDVVDLVIRGIQLANVGLNRFFALFQSGKLRWYLLGVSLGGVLIFGVEVLL